MPTSTFVSITFNPTNAPIDVISSASIHVLAWVMERRSFPVQSRTDFRKPPLFSNWIGELVLGVPWMTSYNTSTTAMAPLHILDCTSVFLDRVSRGFGCLAFLPRSSYKHTGIHGSTSVD